MLAGMKRRLERLERLSTRTVLAARWPLMLWNLHPQPKERIEKLAPHERVVNDWYRDIGGIVFMRERITTDPDDHGRKCEPGNYLSEVLQEIHRDCKFRTQGVCRACAGTPLSETPTAATRLGVDPPPD